MVDGCTLGNSEEPTGLMVMRAHVGTRDLSANLLDLLTSSGGSEPVQLQHLMVSLAAEGGWTKRGRKCADTASMFTWRVSTYAQQSPVDAVLDKGHVVLEDLLDIDDLAKVLCSLLTDSSIVTPCQCCMTSTHSIYAETFAIP